MADNTNDLAQLERIRRRELSEQEREILNVFALAIRPGVLQADGAVEAARQLDALCPPLDQNKNAKDYIWAVWDIMLDIAGSPDVQDQVHHCLVSVLQELALIAKGQLNRDRPDESEFVSNRVWRDFPELGTCFHDSYYDPIHETAEMRTKLAPIWHKLTIFGARALAAGVLSPYTQAMHAVKSGLEQDLNALPAAEMAEWRVKVACAWLSHGGAKPLLWWAKENMEYGNVEDESNSITRGLLYHGPAIMCFDRWNFWL